ncbi:MAG: hypothetical protein V7K88_09875 [Nostoc sp.]
MKQSPISTSTLFDLCKRSPRKFAESAMAMPAAGIALAVIDFPKQNVP